MRSPSTTLPAARLAFPILVLATLLAAPHRADAAAVEEITTANAAGKPVFLVVADGPGPGLEAARATAAAAKALAPQAAVVEIDRRDPAQAPAVASYRLAAAPVPLLLVVASNGVPAGAARPGTGAAERLVSLIPTPRKAEYLKHLSEQRVAIVALSTAKMPLRGALLTEASGAIQQLEGKAALVLVDLDDPREAKFLAEMKADPAAAQPVVLVVNPKGQTLGRFQGAPAATQLVEAARKKHACTDPGCKDCGR